MSVSKVIIGAVGTFLGALLGAGIITTSTTQSVQRTEKVVASTEAVVEATTSAVSAIVQTQKPPVDPIDPEPIPSPTPRPTPVPTAPNGSIGCQFPPIYDKWWLRPTDQYAYLAGLVEDDKYRTNIMFNWEGQFKHEIEAVSSTGMVLGSLSFDTYMLESCTPDNITYRDGVCSGMFQLNKFVEQIDPNYTGTFSIRIKPTGGTGRVFFYATMIDNKSSDCTTFTQFRRTKNNNMWAESGLYYQGSADAETESF